MISVSAAIKHSGNLRYLHTPDFFGHIPDHGDAAEQRPTTLSYNDANALPMEAYDGGPSA